MDEGLLFWLVIAAVAVLQGIGQKKKKPGKPGQGLPGSKPKGQQLPGAKARGPQASNRPRPRQTGPGDGEPDLTTDEGTSSESMIPSDVWEEILGLARGKPKGRTPQPAPSEEMEQTLPMGMGELDAEELARRAPREPEPKWTPPSPATSRPDYTPAAREFPTSHGANAVLHATKPSESGSRLGVPRQAAVLGSEGQGDSVRAELFGGGTLRELRKAIVHQEVLGKPVSLKEDR